MIREQIMVDWLPFGLSQCKGSGECGCMCVVGGWGVLGGVGEGGGERGSGRLLCTCSIPLDSLLLFSCFLQDAANHLKH